MEGALEINQLGLKTYTLNRLNNPVYWHGSGLIRVHREAAELAKASPLELLKIKGFGRRSLLRSRDLEMRRLLAQHRFTNKARIAVYQVRLEPGVPKVDTLLLAFTTSRGKWIGTHMRADEALLVIEKLSRGLYRSIRGWHVEKIRPRKRK